MHLIIVGLSHKTAPIEIRERLTFPAHKQAEALSLLTSDDRIAEAVIISTCNRTEIYAVASGDDEGVDAVIDFMATYHSLDRHELVRSLYMHRSEDVVRHLFRVVSSLDSMVIGEAQILGQVKEGYEHALGNGATGKVFNKLFRQSFEVGKRVRTETEIGENAVSISYAAIELAKKVFDTLQGRTILILGAGKMSELTAKHLVSNGVKTVLVANRTFERAQDLASRFNGEAVRYDDLYTRMRDADVVISSTSATHYVITKEQVAQSMRGRGGRPLFLIDIAVPRDIEPAVNELGNVFLYDIDELTGVVESNLEERMREARRAEAIIDEEFAAFMRWRESLEVQPTIAAIRARAEVIREGELEKAYRRLGDLSDKDRQTVDALTSAIVNKMLHGPTQRLKQAAEAKDGYEYIETARHLYGLDESEGRGHGRLRDMLNRRAKEITEITEITSGEAGDSLGC
ncbi:MAG: glutamyl-tRNA reductase [Actinomycetia bacterium]|nr:glutamyl-tRNA reductase [Actinomycetes bacterium]